eukprot:scaffold29617_cov24-Tisochrysis_lutea.AAC.1
MTPPLALPLNKRPVVVFIFRGGGRRRLAVGGGRLRPLRTSPRNIFQRGQKLFVVSSLTIYVVRNT